MEQDDTQVLTHPLFEALTAEDRAALGPLIGEIEIEAGATILSAGEHADEAYIVLSGSVEVHAGEPRAVLETLSPGDLFGEQGLLTPSQPGTHQLLRMLLRMSH